MGAPNLVARENPPGWVVRELLPQMIVTQTEIAGYMPLRLACKAQAVEGGIQP